MSNRVFIIAEAGVNHNGSLALAKKLVDEAARAGADAVKFQTFRAVSLASKYAPKAQYQRHSTARSISQFGMLKKLELGAGAHKALIGYCKKKRIIFISAPFDLESLCLLGELGLKIIKIPSGEITNLPYLKKIGSLKKRLIMSTGMADLKEIKRALDALISSGTKKRDITVLHCNTAYPTPVEDVNLKAMIAIRDKLKVKIGYSDHTPGIEVPIAAAALGASVVEKHFTLDRNMKGPDHKASLEPGELHKMVTAIRNVEKALGRGLKRPSKSELKNICAVRKSIVAATNIKKGEFFSDRNVTVKRPAGGISPMKWDAVIGKVSKKYFKKDEMIEV